MNKSYTLNSSNSMIPFRAIYLFFLLHSFFISVGQEIPMECFDSQKYYSKMWWEKKEPIGEKVLMIATNNYTFSFDYGNLKDIYINVDGNEKDYRSSRLKLDETKLSHDHLWQIRFGIESESGINWCYSAKQQLRDCQLIESGKYFHRRFITNLENLTGLDKYNSGLEISSWPDRLALILKGISTTKLSTLTFIIELSLPDSTYKIINNEGVISIRNSDNTFGYVVFKSEKSSVFQIEGSKIVVKFEKTNIEEGDEINTGIIVYPIDELSEEVHALVLSQETTPIEVKATQVSPKRKELKVDYDSVHGWYQVNLRNDGLTKIYHDSINDRIERVFLEMKNKTPDSKQVRLNFAKGRFAETNNNVFGITGISAVLRDRDGFPIGIPIQLSKNWHLTGFDKIGNHYFRGSWYHGLCMLTIPADTTIKLEYTSVNAHWGGVPAASHAQLCLVGWDGHQQWEQTAIGSWGENITFEPDMDMYGAIVQDFRPLMIDSYSGEKWKWTSNTGGADFCNLTGKNGKRSSFEGVQTNYQKYSPNLTDVEFSGLLENGKMEYLLNTKVYRSDDLTRGVFRLKINVLDSISFNDFVIFQAAAQYYHYANSKTLAWGNESGLKKLWEADTGGNSRYVTTKTVASGRLPWFSFTDSKLFPKGNPPDQKPANRGFIIRKWNARINGENNVPPYFAEFNSSDGSAQSSSLINITLPKGCSKLHKGDYIETEIELFQIPVNGADYYGPNRLLKNAIEQNPNSWRMVMREAIGNQIQVKETSGCEVKSSYPIEIETKKTVAEFSVIGGIGYVPVTFTNVITYRNPKLYEKLDGKWVEIDQAVYGNDYWQAEFDPHIKSWEITYNVNLDSTDDKKRKREFRFEPGF